MNITKAEIANILTNFHFEKPMTQKVLWVFRAYGNGKNCCKWNLAYDAQLKFKDVAHRYFGLNKNLYYFDDVYCVDAKTNKNIPGVRCDGKLQFGEAIDKLKAYFKIESKDA